MGEHAPEPQGAPAPEPAAQEPVAEPWSGPSQEEWEAQQQFVQNAAPILSQIAQAMEYTQGTMPPQQQPQAPPEPPALDPFDPNSVAARIEYEVNQRVGQYDDLMQLTMAEQGERLARQELERLQTEVGEFDPDMTMLMAAGMLHEHADPSQAMRAAASYVQEMEARIRADERTKHGIALEQHHTAPRETTANSAAMQEANGVPTGPNRYEEVVARWEANRKPQFPIG